MYNNFRKYKNISKYNDRRTIEKYSTRAFELNINVKVEKILNDILLGSTFKAGDFLSYQFSNECIEKINPYIEDGIVLDYILKFKNIDYELDWLHHDWRNQLKQTNDKIIETFKSFSEIEQYQDFDFLVQKGLDTLDQNGVLYPQYRHYLPKPKYSDSTLDGDFWIRYEKRCYDY